ncbi:phage head closure protein [Methylobacterium oxalidis]|uniref:phage head closure protein n=1 Tax=Methylobacterium oxalidis TaxID=944322 RepID=UPI003315C1AD
MRAGLLKNTILIARRYELVDEFGTPTDTWTPIARLRAEVVSSDAKTFLAEAGEQVEAAIVFRTRFRTGIEPGDRVTYLGRDYDLVELKETVARRVMELRCRERRP